MDTDVIIGFMSIKIQHFSTASDIILKNPFIPSSYDHPRLLQ